MRLPRLLYLYPIAAAYSLWTFTFGLLSRSSRCCIALLAYQSPLFKSSIPEVALAEMIGEITEITLHEPAPRSGNVSTSELLVLAGVTRKWRPQNLFEFGTFDGRSSLNLMAQARDDAQLYTLDLPASGMETTHLAVEEREMKFIDKKASGLRFQGTPYAARISQLYGDSATFDFSPYFGRMDLIFVDASHAYEYVRCDTETALKLLRPSGGVILWHDYSRDWPGVIRALDEFYKSDPRFRSLRRIESTTLAMLTVGDSAGKEGTVS